MRLRSRIYLILLGTIAALPATAAFAQEAPKKAPVPDDAAQVAAMKTVRDVYENEFAAAKTVDQKKALARSLLRKARRTHDDPDGKFAMLKAARNVATQAMDLETAFEAIDAVTESYREAAPQNKSSSQEPHQNANEPKEPVFGTAAKASVLHSLQRNAHLPEDHLSITKSAMGLLDKAVAEDQWDVALELSSLGLDEARKSHNPPLIRQSQKRLGEVQQAAKAYEAAKTAMEALKGAPDDPEANLIVGKFVCFIKGDWERGVPMLALGKDADLKAVAIKELKGVSSASEQVQLGDAWWDFAQTQPESIRNSAQCHAAVWYRKALPELSGLAQAKVQKRIESVTAAASHETAAAPIKVARKPVMQKTKRVGGSGGGNYEEENDGDMLVGLSITTINWAGHKIIRSIQSHYQHGGDQVSGKTHGKPHGKPIDILAKPGYAIAGIVAVGGSRLDGFRVVFMRVKGNKLDPTQTYESDWVGGKEGQTGTRLGCNGDPVIGIHGGAGAECDGLGLILAE